MSNQTGSNTKQEVVKQEVVITLRGSMNSTESSGQTGYNQAGSNTVIRIKYQTGIGNYMRSSNQDVIMNETLVIMFDLCAQTSHHHYMYF